MPKIIDLEGYNLLVETIASPVIDNGQIVHDGHGQPKTQTVKRMCWICPHGLEVIRIGLPDELRRELVEALTGGITVPTLEIAHG